ncbi:DUF5050 domain-containing protein [Patescibacteria group bacterium]
MAKNKAKKRVTKNKKKSFLTSDIDLSKFISKNFTFKDFEPVLFIFVFSLMLGLLSVTFQVSRVQRLPEIFQEDPYSSPAPVEGDEKIIFHSDRGGNRDIYSINPDGSDVVNLTNNSYTEVFGALSPDGTKITYSKLDDAGNNDLWIMNSNGTNQQQLLDLNFNSNIDSDFSPDGNYIVYDEFNSSIWIVNVDGSNNRLLASGFGRPEWSNDNIIYFTKDDGTGNLDIWKVNPDGSGLSEVGGTTDDDNSAVPCDNYIFFTCHTDTQNEQEVCRMNKDGSGLIEITDTGFEDWVRACSPDETKLAFWSNRDGNYEIYTMELNGNNVLRITNNSSIDKLGDWGIIRSIDTSFLQGRVANKNGDPSATCPFYPYWRPSCNDCSSGYCEDAPGLTITCDSTTGNWSCNACGAYYTTGSVYSSGDQATCTITNPPEGYRFAYWTWEGGNGECSGDGNYCTATLDSLTSSDNNLWFYIESDLVSPSPIPSASPPDSQAACVNEGGTWSEFSNACADLCEAGDMCAQVITWSCDCGVDKCWDVDTLTCVDEATRSPSPSPDPQTACVNEGGTWSEFPNGCADICGVSDNCIQVVTWSCDCGDNKCWNVDALTCDDDIIIGSAAPSPTPTVTSVDILVKLDGVPANDNNMNLPEENREQTIRIGFDMTNDFGTYGYAEIFETFTYNPDTKNFEVFLDEVPTPYIAVLLKGPSHRQIRFCLKEGQTKDYVCGRDEYMTIDFGENNILNLTGHALEFGDVDWDGSVGVADYSMVKACVENDARMGQDIYDNDDGCWKSDGNLDGVVDNTDIVLLYNTLSSKPDDE